MTQKELRLIRRAIHLLHHEDDYEGGMDILASLAKIKVRKVDLKRTTLAEMSSHGNRKFRVKEK